MARNGRNTVIYKGTFVSNHSLSTEVSKIGYIFRKESFLKSIVVQKMLVIKVGLLLFTIFGGALLNILVGHMKKIQYISY